MTMDKAKAGTTYKVSFISSDEKIRKFLKTLGLYENSEVTLISKTGTNFILNIKDSRYAIDASLASKITVEVA